MRVLIGQRYLLIFSAVLLTMFALRIESGEVEIPSARDFQQDAAQAQVLKLPLLVMVASESCGYCELLKRDVIRPMIISRAYEDKVLIRELMLEGADVVDFDGSLTTANDFARRYKAYVTPTVLLLGPDGAELVPSTAGVPNIEFYGYSLDQSIEQALVVLNPS